MPSIIYRATEPDAAGVVALIRQAAMPSPCGMIREIREFASGWSPTLCGQWVASTSLSATRCGGKPLLVLRTFRPSISTGRPRPTSKHRSGSSRLLCRNWCRCLLHRHGVQAGDGPNTRFARLCPDERGDDKLRPHPGQAVSAREHPGEWRDTRPNLDTAAGDRRCNTGQARNARARHRWAGRVSRRNLSRSMCSVPRRAPAI